MSRFISDSENGMNKETKRDLKIEMLVSLSQKFSVGYCSNLCGWCVVTIGCQLTLLNQCHKRIRFCQSIVVVTIEAHVCVHDHYIVTTFLLCFNLNKRKEFVVLI